MLPSKNEEYATKEYWDERYRHEGTEGYDWFKSYEGELKENINRLLPQRNIKVGMLGCGNSKLSADMYDDGYTNLVNIDYSEIVVENMRRLHCESRPSMEWVVGDIRDLPFESGTFDALIDKGTLDAMAIGNQWNPPPEVLKDCNAEIDEVCRLLTPSGTFIYLTFGQPHFRKRFLDRPGWSLSVSPLGQAFHYYLYVMRSNENHASHAN